MRSQKQQEFQGTLENLVYSKKQSKYLEILETSERRFLGKLPGTAHLGGLHMRLDLSGFRSLLLLLFVCPLLLLQGRVEMLGELGNEVFV